jgi:hypothetical protein
VLPSGGVSILPCKPVGTASGEPGTIKFLNGSKIFSLIKEPPGIFLIFFLINPSSLIGFLFSSNINLPLSSTL